MKILQLLRHLQQFSSRLLVFNTDQVIIYICFAEKIHSYMPYKLFVYYSIAFTFSIRFPDINISS